MSVNQGGRARRVGFRTVAAIAALLTLLLTVGSTERLFDPDLSDGNRLSFAAHVPWLALGWCAAFVAMLWRPRATPAALQQALAMLTCLYAGGMVIGRDSDPVFYLGFGGVLALLVWLHPERRSVFRSGRDGVSVLLLPLSLAAAAPLTLYTVDLDQLARQVGNDGPFYTGAAATALAVPLVGLAASLRARGFRLPGWTAAVMLASLGVGSLLAAGDPGALPGWGAVLALVGAVLYAAATEWEKRRLVSSDRTEPSESLGEL